MAKSFAILLGIALSLGAALLFYQNRDAKALYPIYFSVFCAGALGFIVTAFATLEAKPIKDSFAVGSRFDPQGRMPLETKTPIGLQMTAIAPKYKEQLSDTSNPEGAIPMITEATRMAVVTELCRLHATGWDLTVRKYNIHSGRTTQFGSTPRPSTELSADHFSEFLASSTQAVGFPKKGHFPPNMTVKAQHDAISRTLILANGFTTLRITVRKGEYSRLNEPHLPYYAACYIDVEADFVQWRAGHPMMELHKAWVRNILSHLRDLEWEGVDK